MNPRFIQTRIEKQFRKQKVVLLYGTCSKGKATIIENIAEKYGNDVLLLQGEDIQVASLIQERTIANYEWLTKGKVKIPTAFSKEYPDAVFNVVNQGNYLDFIT